ncbi:hypothetical protein, partial [Microcoleus sp. herbarium12]|uniref:hypothetical protein n=1 Tax=Microcoleus sp. herbarium12 TaxID=3055437 RepID=UPI002FD02818
QMLHPYITRASEGEAFGYQISRFLHELSPKCFTPTSLARRRVKHLDIKYRVLSMNCRPNASPLHLGIT